jgi:Ca2+-binding RTX toxin-like protein
MELAGEGIDTVRILTEFDYNLGANVENAAIIGSGDSNLYGNDLDNVLTGGAGNNLIYGFGGNDTISGGSGGDYLAGYGGNDTIDGGDGDDTLAGDGGADILTGGDGTDTFEYGAEYDSPPSGADTITDFSDAEFDRIDVSFFAYSSTPLHFVGTAAFSNTAGELRYEQVGGDTFIEGDVDGDGTTDFLVQLTGVHTLNSGDFIFF